MPVTVSWDNEEKTVLRYDFDLIWTWDEFFTTIGDAFAMTRSVGHTVDIISNFKPGASLPSNSLFQFRRAMSHAPRNRGRTVIVGSSTIVRSMVMLFSRFNRHPGERVHLADSLEHARTILAEPPH